MERVDSTDRSDALHVHSNSLSDAFLSRPRLPLQDLMRACSSQKSKFEEVKSFKGCILSRVLRLSERFSMGPRRNRSKSPFTRRLYATTREYARAKNDQRSCNEQMSRRTVPLEATFVCVMRVLTEQEYDKYSFTICPTIEP